MATDISAQQTMLLRQIKQKQSQINQIFKQLQIKQPDVFNTQSQSSQQQQKPNLPSSVYTSNPQSYLQKYSQYSIKQIRQNYNNKFLPFKWLQLPICKKLVFEKIQFCFSTSLATTAAYFIWRKSGNINYTWNLKQFCKNYIAVTIIMCSAVLIQSLIYQPYCDINSFHYNNNLKNIEIARLLQKQYQKLDKNAFKKGLKLNQ